MLWHYAWTAARSYYIGRGVFSNIERKEIGLYSLKNETVYEIDAVTLSIKQRCITINADKLDSVPLDLILRETMKAERALFKKIIGKDILDRDGRKTAGVEIFDFLQQLLYRINT